MTTGCVSRSKNGWSEQKIRTRPPKFTDVHNGRMISSLLPFTGSWVQNSLRLWSALFIQQVDTNRSFQFQKCSQLFIRAHDEAVSVAAMRVHNPDCAPLKIQN